MMNPRSLAAFSSQVSNAPTSPELEQRLGLYRVFLKLYEHHRNLLDELLELENLGDNSPNKVDVRYIQGVISGEQSYLITNLLEGKTQVLCQPQQIWTIGRTQQVALSIQDRRLSRCHAAIRYVKHHGFYLIDLGSTNGSFINGEPLRHYALLKDGDRVRLGGLAFTFFSCSSAQILDAVSPQILNQINAIHPLNASVSENGSSSAAARIEPALLPETDETYHESEETFGFLQSGMPKLSPENPPTTPHFKASRPSELLEQLLESKRSSRKES